VDYGGGSLVFRGESVLVDLELFGLVSVGDIFRVFLFSSVSFPAYSLVPILLFVSPQFPLVVLYVEFPGSSCALGFSR